MLYQAHAGQIDAVADGLARAVDRIEISHGGSRFRIPPRGSRLRPVARVQREASPGCRIQRGPEACSLALEGSEPRRRWWLLGSWRSAVRWTAAGCSIRRRSQWGRCQPSLQRPTDSDTQPGIQTAILIRTTRRRWARAVAGARIRAPKRSRGRVSQARWLRWR